MIQPDELRIGNWVSCHVSADAPVRVLAISLNKVYFDLDNEIIDLDVIDMFGNVNLCSWEVYPIPLTLEVLEKCGFEVSNIGNHIFYKNGVIIFFENGKWGISCDSRCSLNYLHQLQNLYFALTGKELNYTP